MDSHGKNLTEITGAKQYKLPTQQENLRQLVTITRGELTRLQSLAMKAENLETELFESRVDSDYRYNKVLEERAIEATKVDELSSQCRALKLELRETEEKNHKLTLQVELNQLSSKIHESSSSLSQVDNSQIKTPHESIADVQIETRRLVQKIKKEDDVANSLSAELVKTIAIARSREGLVVRLRQDIEAAENIIQENEYKIRLLQTSVHRRSHETVLLRRALAQAQENVEHGLLASSSHLSEISALKTTIDSIEAKLTQSNSENISLSQQLTIANDKLYQLQSSLAETEAINFRLEKELKEELESGAKQARDAAQEDRTKYITHIQEQEATTLKLRESLVEAKKDSYSHMKQLMEQQQFIFNLQTQVAEYMKETEVAQGKQREIEELQIRTQNNLVELEQKRKKELEDFEKSRAAEQQQLQVERAKFEAERLKERENLERTLSNLERELRAKTITSVERAKLEIDRQKIAIELENKKLQQQFADKERALAKQVRFEVEKEREAERLAFQREVMAFEKVEKERIAKLQAIQRGLKDAEKRQTEKLLQEKRALAQIATVQLKNASREIGTKHLDTNSEDEGIYHQEEYHNDLSTNLSKQTNGISSLLAGGSKSKPPFTSSSEAKPRKRTIDSGKDSTTSDQTKKRSKKLIAESESDYEAEKTNRPKASNTKPPRIISRVDDDIILSFAKPQNTTSQPNVNKGQVVEAKKQPTVFATSDFDRALEDSFHEDSFNDSSEINQSVSAYLDMLKPVQLSSNAKQPSAAVPAQGKKRNPASKTTKKTQLNVILPSFSVPTTKIGEPKMK